MPCPPTRSRGEMLVGTFTRFVLSSPCFFTAMSRALVKHLPGRTTHWCWGRAPAAASRPFLPAKAPLWAQHHGEGMAHGTQPAHITLSLVYLFGPKSMSVPSAGPAMCLAGWGSILQGPGSHLFFSGSGTKAPLVIAGQTWRNCCQCRRYLHLLLCGRGQVLVSQPPRRGADALKVLLPGHSQAPCAHCNLGSQGPQGARMLGLAPQCQWLAGAVCSSQQDVGSPVPALCTAYM